MELTIENALLASGLNNVHHINLYNMQTGAAILHYPRLDTVLMIEDAIKHATDYPRRTVLWKKLPKKVMYQTYKVVLDYLIQSRKIMLTNDDKLVWIFADTAKAAKLLARSVPAHA